MKATLHLYPGRHIHEVQHEFSEAYPFLRIEFYKMQPAYSHMLVRKHLNHSVLLKMAGLKNPGLLQIEDKMTVAELENILLDQFGLHTQVTRQSGIIWLETTMTDDWTLSQQNEHGKEITNGTGGYAAPEDFDLTRGVSD